MPEPEQEGGWYIPRRQPAILVGLEAGTEEGERASATASLTLRAAASASEGETASAIATLELVASAQETERAGAMATGKSTLDWRRIDGFDEKWLLLL